MLSKHLFAAGTLLAFLTTQGICPNPAFALRNSVEGVPWGLEKRLKEATGLEESLTLEGPSGLITLETETNLIPIVEILEHGGKTSLAPVQQVRDALEEVRRQETEWEVPLSIFYDRTSPPMLWILEHLYNPATDLTDEQRKRIRADLLESLSDAGRSRVSFETDHPLGALEHRQDNETALEGWLYILIRLLLIQQKLETQATSSGEWLQQQQEFIQQAYRIILFGFEDARTENRVPQNPKSFYERKLYPVAQQQPALALAIRELFQSWNDWAEDGRVLYFSLLDSEEPDLLDDGQSETVILEITDKAKRAQWMAGKELGLRSVLKPRNQWTNSAWHDAVTTIVNKTQESGTDTAVLLGHVNDGAVDNSKQEPLNGWLFQLDWIDQMANAGFKHWLIAPAANYLDPIHQWISKLPNDDRVPEDLLSHMRLYLKGNDPEGIRSTLGLPTGSKEAEPAYVTRSLKFWQKLLGLKLRHRADVTLLFNRPYFSMSSTGENGTFEQWLKQKGRKLILGKNLLGGQFSWKDSPELAGAFWTFQIESDDRFSSLDFYERFQFGRAVLIPLMGFSIHQLGERIGWGASRSVAIPISGNTLVSNYFSQNKTPDDTLLEWARRAGGFYRYHFLSEPIQPGSPFQMPLIRFLVVSSEPDEEGADPSEPLDSTQSRDPIFTGLPANTAGLEEISEAVQGAGVVVMEASVLEDRPGLMEFARQIRGPLAKRLILVGLEEAEARKLREQNPAIQTVPAGDLDGLVVALVGLEEAERVTHVGKDRLLADQLIRILPASMSVVHVGPATGLEELLLSMGVPASILDQLDAAGLEEDIARSRAA